MLTKAALTLAAAAAVLGPCDPTGAKPPKDVVGMWGGENAALIADDTSAHIHIGCTYGNIHQQIILDAEGRFDLPGEHNITAHPVDRGILHPARFVGRLAGGRWFLKSILTETTGRLVLVKLSVARMRRRGAVTV